MSWLKALWASVKSGAWKADVPALLALGVTLGVLTADQVSAVQNVINGAASLVAVIIGAVHTFKDAKVIKAAAQAQK